MTEKQQRTAQMAGSPLAMRLFAALSTDKTPSYCVTRLCSLRMTRLQIVNQVDPESATGSTLIIIAAKLQGTKRVLRSNEIEVAANSPTDIEIDLTFSLQYPHFLKRSANMLHICIQRKKRYKTKAILGYKTLALGLIDLDEVLQRGMLDLQLELYSCSHATAPGAASSASKIDKKSNDVAVARLHIVSVTSTPVIQAPNTISSTDVHHHYEKHSKLAAGNGADSDDEAAGGGGDLSQSEPDDLLSDNEHASTSKRRGSNSRKLFTSNRPKNNIKQKFRSLVRKFRASGLTVVESADGQQAAVSIAGEDGDGPLNIDELMDELDDFSVAGDANGQDSDQEPDTMSVISAPRPSVRPYYALTASPTMTSGLSTAGGKHQGASSSGGGTFASAFASSTSNGAGQGTRTNRLHSVSFVPGVVLFSPGGSTRPQASSSEQQTSKKTHRSPNAKSLFKEFGGAANLIGISSRSGGGPSSSSSSKVQTSSTNQISTFENMTSAANDVAHATHAPLQQQESFTVTEETFVEPNSTNMRDSATERFLRRPLSGGHSSSSTVTTVSTVPGGEKTPKLPFMDKFMPKSAEKSTERLSSAPFDDPSSAGSMHSPNTNSLLPVFDPTTKIKRKKSNLKEKMTNLHAKFDSTLTPLTSQTAPMAEKFITVTREREKTENSPQIATFPVRNHHDTSVFAEKPLEIELLTKPAAATRQKIDDFIQDQCSSTGNQSEISKNYAVLIDSSLPSTNLIGKLKFAAISPIPMSSFADITTFLQQLASRRLPKEQQSGGLRRIFAQRYTVVVLGGAGDAFFNAILRCYVQVFSEKPSDWQNYVKFVPLCCGNVNSSRICSLMAAQDAVYAEFFAESDWADAFSRSAENDNFEAEQKISKVFSSKLTPYLNLTCSAEASQSVLPVPVSQVLVSFKGLEEQTMQKVLPFLCDVKIQLGGAAGGDFAHARSGTVPIAAPETSLHAVDSTSGAAVAASSSEVLTNLAASTPPQTPQPPPPPPLPTTTSINTFSSSTTAHHHHSPHPLHTQISNFASKLEQQLVPHLHHLHHLGHQSSSPSTTASSPGASGGAEPASIDLQIDYWYVGQPADEFAAGAAGSGNKRNKSRELSSSGGVGGAGAASVENDNDFLQPEPQYSSVMLGPTPGASLSNTSVHLQQQQSMNFAAGKLLKASVKHGFCRVHVVKLPFYYQDGISGGATRQPPPFSSGVPPQFRLTLVSKEKKKLMSLGKKKTVKDADNTKSTAIDGVHRIVCSALGKSHTMNVVVDGVKWPNVKFFQIAQHWTSHVKVFPLALCRKQAISTQMSSLYGNDSDEDEE